MERQKNVKRLKKKNENERGLVRILVYSILFCAALSIAVASFFLFPNGTAATVVEIPDCTGRLLSHLSLPNTFDLHVEYRYDGERESGVVLSQSPAPGSLRKLADASARCRLTLTVSLGTEFARLPQLVGKSAREAEQELLRLGFLVKTVKKESAHPAGRVFDMAPAAQTQLPLGESVTLYVSAGVPQKSVTVPDLRGLSRNDALVRVWLAGLAVAEVREVCADASLAGIVISQSHLPGTTLPAGTGILLCVGGSQPEKYENER